ncbi:hypothetical protein [Streptomyces erythrochromogenes]|uniref:hypothetical protein n=1 Tax=Streptomyces erythrochromogenes TaxID=285574 RepID=UPI00368B6D70
MRDEVRVDHRLAELRVAPLPQQLAVPVADAADNQATVLRGIAQPVEFLPQAGDLGLVAFHQRGSLLQPALELGRVLGVLKVTQEVLAPALEVVTSGEERGDPGLRRLVDCGGGLLFGEFGVLRPELQGREGAVEAFDVVGDLLQAGLGGPDLGSDVQPPLVLRALGVGGAERQVPVLVGQLVAAQAADAVLHRGGRRKPVQAGRTGRDAQGVEQALRFGQHVELDEVTGRWPGPPLNSGEVWADQAIKDAGVGGEPWGRLLSHAAPATASAPSARWRRDALALIEEIGPETVREAVPRWFELAGLDRTVPLVGHPHLPFDVNTCFDALAGLVETSLDQRSGEVPRAPHVAEAGVVALALTADPAARCELETLRRWIRHKGTLLRIDTALDQLSDRP